MKRTRSVVLSMITLLLVLLIGLIAAAPAAAKPGKTSDLLEAVPPESKLVVGMNVPKLRTSFLFEELLGLIDRLQGDSDILGFLLADAGLDLRSDVGAIVLGQPDVSLTPGGVPSEMVVVVDAKFDATKLVAAAKKRFGKLTSTSVSEGLMVHDTGAFRFAVVSPERLVFTSNAGAYDTAVWKTVADAKSGAAASKDLQPLLKSADTTRSLWVVALTGHLRQPGVPVAESSVMEIDLDKKGLDVVIRSAMTTEDGAKKTLEQMTTLRAQSASNPLVQMLGAKPLIENLKASRDAKSVVLKTSMTEPQLRTMFERVKVMSQQPPAVTPGAPTPSTAPAAPRPAPGGVDADFN